MKFHRQLFPEHRPEEGIYGDCARTVIACLLDNVAPDDVPHFAEIADEDEEHGLRLVDDWLAAWGYRRLTFAFEADLEYVGKAMTMWNPGVPYCVIGQTSRGNNHVAIYRDGNLVHDPHPSDEGITAPTGEGYYWIELIARVPNAASHSYSKEGK